MLLQGGNEETEWSRTKAGKAFPRNGKSLGPQVKIGEKIKIEVDSFLSREATGSVWQ